MIATRQEQGLLVLRLSRAAKRNALDEATLSQLADAIRGVGAEDAAAVLIHGEGPCFSSGADVSALDGTGSDIAFDDRLAEVTRAIASCPVPVVAAVHGACVGAAVDLVGSCDVVVADTTAWFALPAVKLGLLYNPEALERLLGRISPTLAVRLLLLGQRIDVEEAARHGLVDHLSAAPASAGAIELAQHMAAYPRQALGATVRFIREARGGALDVDAWQDVRRHLLASQERATAVAALAAATRSPNGPAQKGSM